jgi:large subunit ribosomal protein L33
LTACHWAAGPSALMNQGLTSAIQIRMFRVSEDLAMAKTNTVQIKLVSSADTGFFYVTKKNARTQTGKLELKKYDPVVRKHVAFREAKIK